ncbi:hypothetical protein J7K19_05785 [bacterium]|nr:hypothetical protein [bacterium]
MILSVPESATRNEISELLSEEKLDVFFETYAESLQTVTGRESVIMYGDSECDQANRVANFLIEKEVKK